MEPPLVHDEKSPTPSSSSVPRPPRGPRPFPSLEIRLFYVRISPCAPDAVPPHLTLSHLRKSPTSTVEINGGGNRTSDPSSLSLRRDRVDRDLAEVTYVSTDSVRLSGAVDIEISDDRGNLILCGSLDRTEALSSVQHHAPSSSDKDPKTGWTMDCCTAASITSSAFVQQKLGISSPSLEVYVAGCFAGSPLILTQTVHLAPRQKVARLGDVDSLLEDDETPVREPRGEEGSQRRKGPPPSSVMEPFHNKSQPQPYQFHPVTHPQYHPQFVSQTSPMQFVQMLPQPPYQQQFLNPQYSHMQPQCPPQRSSSLYSQAHDQTQSQEQLQCTNKRGTPNKRWKPNYDDFLIPFLVEQAREGMKVDRTFKRHAFVAAAAAVNARFRESFTWENVENHMRTLKTKYQEIKKCREFNGAIWNEDLKMITLDDVTYQAYVEGNPKAKEYINKPIENYDGLKIICGDEPVMKKNAFQSPKIGDATDLYQDPSSHDEEVEAPVVGSTCTEAPTLAPTSPSSSRNGRAYKRLRDNIESVILELARKVGDVAEAINNARPMHWTAQLYEKIMELDEFDSIVQEAAFDTLRQDEAEARAFIVKNKVMRFSWMERFMAERFSD